jgi:hypothetical protein
MVSQMLINDNIKTIINLIKCTLADPKHQTVLFGGLILAVGCCWGGLTFLAMWELKGAIVDLQSNLIEVKGQLTSLKVEKDVLNAELAKITSENSTMRYTLKVAGAVLAIILVGWLTIRIMQSNQGSEVTSNVVEGLKDKTGIDLFVPDASPINPVEDKIFFFHYRNMFYQKVTIPINPLEDQVFTCQNKGLFWKVIHKADKSMEVFIKSLGQPDENYMTALDFITGLRLAIQRAEAIGHLTCSRWLAVNKMTPSFPTIQDPAAKQAALKEWSHMDAKSWHLLNELSNYWPSCGLTQAEIDILLSGAL